MIELYTANSSNGHRAAIMLEECGLRYSVHVLDLMAGEQRKPAHLKLNPAGAIPVMVDPEGPNGQPLTLAQSGAILVYLATKTGKFMPTDPTARAFVFQWLLFAASDVSMISTMIFFDTVLMPEKSPANVAFSEERLVRYFRVVDERLATREYLVDTLSIADFALYPVVRVRNALVERDGGMANLSRWAAALDARPAIVRALAATA